MNGQVLSAVIQGGAVIVAAIIGGVFGAYRERIANYLWGTRAHHYLRGDWDCTWLSPSPAAWAPQLQDRVAITKVNGTLIEGKGSTPGFGDWKLQGNATELAATLMYSGEHAKKELIGVVILKRENPTTLSGVWAQYTGSGELANGTTTWKREGQTPQR